MGKALPEEQLRAIGRGLGDKFKWEKVEPILAADGVQVFKAELEELLQTASSPDLTPSHRIAACNALCGFADQCALSKHHELHEMVCNQETCAALLDVYIRRFESAKAKSMKQVLDTVMRNIAQQEPVKRTESIDQTLETILRIILALENHAHAKPGFHTLASLLNKRMLTTRSLLDCCSIISKLPKNYGTSQDQGLETVLLELLHTTFDWVPQADIAPVIGQFLSAFLKQMQEDPDVAKIYTNVWSKCLVESILRHFDDSQPFVIQLFPVLFKTRFATYWEFLDHLKVSEYFSVEDSGIVPSDSMSQQIQRAIILCSALQVGKSLGLVEITDSQDAPAISKSDTTVQLRDKAVSRLVQDANPVIRIAGITILISTFHTSKPFTRGSLELLKSSLPLCFVEPDANFRGELLSQIQHLVDRIKTSTTYLRRIIDQAGKHGVMTDSKDLEQDWQRHKDFLIWFHSLIVQELHPSASYQRHITAVKCLHILIKSGVDQSVMAEALGKNAKREIIWSFHLPIMTTELERMLTDRLMDPFEDIRHFSATAMKVCKLESAKSASFKSGFPSDMLAFEMPSQRASEVMLQTGRMDHSDGYARLVDLMFYFAVDSELGSNGSDQPTSISPNPAYAHIIIQNVASIERGLAIAKRNFATAVDQHPIHGQMTSLRYVLENLVRSAPATTAFLQIETRFLEDLARIQHEVWDCVHGLLCNDAPEGFVPEDMDEDVNLTTKDISSYAWRALKESSLLLRSVIMNIESLAPADIDRVYTHIKSLGDLCFTQLSELRHRGAFSTVAQTFAVICIECLKSTDSRIRSLTEQWYQQTMNLIQARGAKITRRSAGIPPMVIGLLAAGHDFARTINDLKTIANFGTQTAPDGSDLPQVHALNCLKAIFVSTKLVTESEAFLVEVMSLAAKSLASDLWPIRNCGLMLFRGLVDRLLGSHESFEEAFAATTGSRLAYDRFPGLLDLLIDLLARYASNRDVTEQSAAESVFPVLDLFRRAPPPDSRRLEVRPLILEAMGSPQWHIREIAARTYASVVDGDFDQEALQLLEFPELTENVVHGRLLAIKHYLAINKPTLASELPAIRVTMSVLASLARELSETSFSPAALATLLDATHIVSTTVLKSDAAENDIIAHFRAINEAAAHTLKAAPAAHPGASRLESSLGLSEVLETSLQTINQNTRAAKIADILKSLQVEALEWTLNQLLQIQNSTPEAVLSQWIAALEQGHLADPEPRRRSAAQKVWVELSEEAQSRNPHNKTIASSALADLDLVSAIWQDTTPFAVETLLQIWGYSLNAKLTRAGSWSRELVAECSIWIHFVKASLSEDNEFPLRFAAAKSLFGFSMARATSEPTPQDLECEILCTIYTALVDDDEEIRSTAAVCASSIVWQKAKATSSSPSWAAAVAARKICGLLAREHGHSPRLLQAATTRLTGLEDAAQIANPQLAFDAALREDMSLFAVEEQNLYIDEVREAELWSTVLKQLQPSALDPVKVSALEQYAIGGLQCLKRHAQAQTDGALGWTSRAEVFAFGMRVVHAAAVILSWRRVAGAVTAETSALVRSSLVSLSSAPIHPLWRSLVMKVLERDVARGIFRVSGFLNTILA